MRYSNSYVVSAIIAAAIPALASAATSKATYLFNGTFTAEEAGVPALLPTDPLGTSIFSTDTLYAATHPVWEFKGTDVPSEQSGITLDTTGLVSPKSYSAELVLKFNERDGGWRRLLDTENRQSDNGFYVDPGNHLDIFPVVGSSSNFVAGDYHHVVLTVDGGVTSAYLDGNFELTTTSTLLEIDQPNNPGLLLGVFLDNTIAGGQGEWSSGSISLLRLYEGALTPAEVLAQSQDPFAGTNIPEPASLSLFGMAGLLMKRRRSL